jgi:uncharacterized protein
MDSVHVPVFIAVGTEDLTTPPAMAQALFQKANEPKRLYLSPGVDHGHILEMNTERLQAQISAFIQTVQ